MTSWTENVKKKRIQRVDKFAYKIEKESRNSTNYPERILRFFNWSEIEK